MSKVAERMVLQTGKCLSYLAKKLSVTLAETISQNKPFLFFRCLSQVFDHSNGKLTNKRKQGSRGGQENGYFRKIPPHENKD